MSGFTRNTKHYGDQLVYEALGLKWGRYHDRHCGCEAYWLDHAEAAGFTVVREGSGFVALTGPGLTVPGWPRDRKTRVGGPLDRRWARMRRAALGARVFDESRLTTNALWEAVTGKPGSQDWPEPVS